MPEYSGPDIRWNRYMAGTACIFCGMYPDEHDGEVLMLNMGFGSEPVVCDECVAGIRQAPWPPFDQTPI